jgi:chromosome segregation ATPase
MEPVNLTVEILKQIRDEVRGVRDEARGTNMRLDRVEARLDTMDGRLESMDGRLESMDGRLESMDGRLGRVEARLDQHGHAIVRLISEVHGLNDRFDHFLLGPHRDEHAELRARVERLEAKIG